jgi:hypothetical protein
MHGIPPKLIKIAEQLNASVLNPRPLGRVGCWMPGVSPQDLPWKTVRAGQVLAVWAPGIENV